MKLLSISSARAIWLIPTNFVNPSGLFILPIIAAIKERYQFRSSTIDKPPANDNEGIKFEAGAFSSDEGELLVNLTIHNDGFVAETRSSTKYSDLFLEDLMNWSAQQYRLADYRSLDIKKIYANEVYVQFDKSVGLFNEKLSPFFESISNLVGDKYTGPLGFTGLTLGTDMTRSPRALNFKIERQTNTALEENKFYSFAPIQTEPHVQILEQLEEFS